jgi:hypothetical protein
MKIFHCDHCDHLAFFENTQCVSCGHLLAFLPDLAEIGSLEQQGQVWVSPLAAARGRGYRLCRNYALEQVCNWAIDASDPNQLCGSCRLTRVIPDLTIAGNREAWYRLEAAKRRVVYSLLNLRLPFVPDQEDERGLVFEFLADQSQNGEAPVLTGHADGLITINVAEADDAERERRRRALGEPYRTLLGHVRHETGHYYWTRLIELGGLVEPFRRLFGDERADYAAALQHHYAQGPAADWYSGYVSAYASAHPWEDWAETWAHYLHMTDTLETAAACGVSIQPRRSGEPSMVNVPASAGTASGAFDRLIDSWYPLTYMLNNLNRGMGQPDAYPFVLSPSAVEKLRFVHQTIGASAAGGRRTRLAV